MPPNGLGVFRRRALIGNFDEERASFFVSKNSITSDVLGLTFQDLPWHVLSFILSGPAHGCALSWQAQLCVELRRDGGVSWLE